MTYETIKIRAGARLTLMVERADPLAESVTIIMQNYGNIKTQTQEYDETGIAWIEFNSPDTDTHGTWEYQLSENFPDSSPDIYPVGGDCGGCGTCGLPKIVICRSLPMGGIS